MNPHLTDNLLEGEMSKAHVSFPELGLTSSGRVVGSSGRFGAP